MGVPALFRWLSRKYPKIISPVIEDELDEEYGGSRYTDPNPNGEIDNLYLDMNGIVHPCSHPEHKPPPETEDEMFLDVFKYTDRVLMMARPRKVLVIAVDGVAPRAKMNQQRSRRFRSAQDAKIAHEEKERQINERELRGEMIDEAIKGKKSWDSNAITPGTPFMDRLALALRYWVAYKLSTEPGWANLQVIISDATVPGEGEHKLMSFIRLQRLDPEYNPNTSHCIYGLDADLIFLGLATHEPHFRVLREDVFANQSRQLRVSDQLLMSEDQKDALKKKEEKKPFLWLHLNVLREYLEIELYNPYISFPFDLERAIDDWVFICFFAGNDFLPHLPSLDVRDNGIDNLVRCWKRILPKLSDYITCDGNLNLESVEKLLEGLASKEDEIFRKKHEQELRQEENLRRRKETLDEEKSLKKRYVSQISKGHDKAPLYADVNMPLLTTSGENVDGFAQLSNKDIVANRDIITKANMANANAAEALKKLLDSKSNKANEDQISAASALNQEIESKSETDKGENTRKRGFDEVQSDSDDQRLDNDKVRMWEPGYRERYYKSKFHITSEEDIDKVRKDMVKHYLEGISWVLLYYYQGCPSWQWYYPYHYAPFAADFKNIREIVGEEGITFKLGQPFRPYEQLMSVLPAASGHNLPEVFRKLMSDPESEIIDFYPEEFEIDMNGKKMSWQGIALLPFIDEKRLLEAVQKKYELLTEVEKERNTLKDEVLIISKQHKMYETFCKELYEKNQNDIEFSFGKTGLAGEVRKASFDINGITKYPLNQGEMGDLDNKNFLLLFYHVPQKKHGKSMILNGYIPHTKVLNQEDRDAIIYGPQRNNGYRFRRPNDNSDYINTGPSGKDEYLIYSMRRGGYRAFLEHLNNRTSYYEQQSDALRMVNSRYGNNGYNQRQGGYNGNDSNQGPYKNNYRNYNNYNNYGPKGAGQYNNFGYSGNYSRSGPNSAYDASGRGRSSGPSGYNNYANQGYNGSYYNGANQGPKNGYRRR